MAMSGERVILGHGSIVGYGTQINLLLQVICYPIALHLVCVSIVIVYFSWFQLPLLHSRWVSTMQKLVRHNKEYHGIGSEDPCQHMAPFFSPAISVT
jgi:hypothetical protein